MDSEAHPRQESILVQEGDPALAPSTSNHVAIQQPVKKPTRQWAAWTHQEEQSFFAALRQVGKNFEKITCRVQSKNKDQVRHYYYRLVRRMNKLLGPGLYLDSRNSKDTNAAMLRWWSLLEKYSCKASKLHLKPRRFKIFMEALEHQLLKDRKKTVRKRPSQGENCPPEAPSTVSNQSRPSEHDRPVKLVLVDSHNIQKSGPGKASLKRSGSIGVNRGNKGDASTMKPARQRRKPAGVVSSTAAYKKWEKAAIAGVSLVADAAEHLERTIDKDVGQDKSSAEKNSAVPVGNFLPPMPNFPQNIYAENNINNSVKLKLQLFPIDDSTRKALEMDKHNPHLELTLPTRKKISSVMEHLNRKWGSSSVASGELMLFPNSVQQDCPTGYLRWTQDSNVSAGDVYAMIGSPPVFRLRYGWFSTTELGSVSSQAPVASCTIPVEHDMNVEKMKDPVLESASISPLSASNQCVDIHKDLLPSVTKSHSLAQTSAGEPNQKNNLEGDPTESASWHEKVAGDEGILRHQGEVDGLRLHNGTALSAKEWADSLTNISVGDLLSGVPHDLDANCIDQPLAGRSQCLPQIPFSCDSFDAAIAAHISRQKNKMGCEPTMVSHVSSIWDAEETCDAFVFQKNSAFRQQSTSSSGVAPPGACKLMASTSLVGCDRMVEDLPAVERPINDPQRDPMDECQSDPHILESSVKDFNALADIYWPESLGPLDLELPSSKYHNEDFILNDSLSGLNRLIASSLDAFQNCSFFGSNKKEPTPSVEARETISFSDFKIGNGI
ncbi:TSL-kinase interacting protein 1 isoform X1 [Rosa chinensis]|uniref:TSL-kinase interacting protein 1 isoform X1 n=1 Tax=Rosa chinensis TaxID=74649 RepID=UPI000D08BB10|nr:TSL-kinase interacting protein 1 isoform X1 [Rosa chinensis]